ncbi:hypothetical protein HZB96_02345 [Candidatus Gottesmanbacteria bacterium]|nr:hypothetical protein [Candidatus Gottesmanbacteria bacterium]
MGEIEQTQEELDAIKRAAALATYLRDGPLLETVVKDAKVIADGPGVSAALQGAKEMADSITKQ